MGKTIRNLFIATSLLASACGTNNQQALDEKQKSDSLAKAELNIFPKGVDMKYNHESNITAMKILYSMDSVKKEYDRKSESVYDASKDFDLYEAAHSKFKRMSDSIIAVLSKSLPDNEGYCVGVPGFKRDGKDVTTQVFLESSKYLASKTHGKMYIVGANKTSEELSKEILTNIPAGSSVCFLIDVTTSMTVDNDLHDIQKAVLSIIDKLKSDGGKVAVSTFTDINCPNFYLPVAEYGDGLSSKDIMKQVFKNAKSHEKQQNQVCSLEGDTTLNVDMEEAPRTAAKKFISGQESKSNTSVGKAADYVFLIGDAPDHNPQGVKGVEAMVNYFKAKGIVCNIVPVLPKIKK